MQILIGSSDVIHVKMTRFLLEDVGHKVLHGFNSTSVLKVLREEQPELILLDTYCDSIGGFELCREIRALHQVPIIFVASDATMDDKVTGLKLGGDDYMSRPYDAQELLARIEAVMRRSRSAQSTLIQSNAR